MQPTSLQIYRRLLLYVRPHWKKFSISVVGMVIYGATETGFAAMMKPLLDGSFVEKDQNLVAIIPIILVGLFLLRGIAGFISTYTMAWIGQRVVATLRQDMFSHLIKWPSKTYDQHSTGTIISKLTYNVEQVAQGATQAITIMIRDSVTLLGLLIWMFILNWKFALLFLLVGPLIGLVVHHVGSRMRRVSSRIQESMGSITHVIEEAVIGQKVVKLFGGKAYEENHFSDINQHNRGLQMKMVAASAISTPITQFFTASILAIIIYLASKASLNGELSVGSFMSLVLAMTLMLQPLKRLTQINAHLQKAIAAGKSIFELLDSDIEHDHGKQTLSSIAETVRFDNVVFRYQPELEPVLNSVSLTVKRGETVAIVGRSGSGKSTLVSLLPRFYELTDGAITINDINITDLTMSNLREQVALVSQDIQLFNDSIANNIAYGTLKGASREAIEEAAELAHAMPFIRKMPKGLDTEVGDNGVLLSGGQRQRIAIARAILKDAPILILDEATSALDSESEQHIQQALANLTGGRATLVIAHRLSTIENADNILVLDHGQLVEQGHHQALIQQGGLYADLHRIQFRESGDVKGYL